MSSLYLSRTLPQIITTIISAKAAFKFSSIPPIYFPSKQISNNLTLVYDLSVQAAVKALCTSQQIQWKRQAESYEQNKEWKNEIAAWLYCNLETAKLFSKLTTSQVHWKKV